MPTDDDDLQLTPGAPSPRPDTTRPAKSSPDLAVQDPDAAQLALDDDDQGEEQP